MSTKTTTVRYGSDRKLVCFAYPDRAKAPRPAVLVLQEARGVDEPASRQSGGDEIEARIERASDPSQCP
ncbi:MAG TPA: hypothetical protein VII82_05840 [Polyangiaceae bacterium]|jgi:dienelactone hydrolase